MSTDHPSPVLPAGTGIGRVQLRVADTERALAFYRDILGLRVVGTDGSITRLATSDDAEHDATPPFPSHELIVLREVPGATRRPARPRTTGLYHVALLVPSRRALGRAYRALQEHRYPMRGASDHAVSESLYLDDPDGNGLEIYGDKPRALWPMHDGVVQMTIDPLDLAGVLAAAAQRPAPWRGLPSETLIGHVHFTVSQLDRSIAFYRDVIGFEVGFRMPTLVAVAAGGYHHHLNLNLWAGENAPPDDPGMAGIDWWELRVPDESARHAVGTRLAGTTERDPDGIVVRLAA